MLLRVLALLGLAVPLVGHAQAPKILVLGDSLGAAYGVPQPQGWTALLQQRLTSQGYPHQVVNASISGDTTAGGLARLAPALQQHQPKIVLVELGANDAFRGLKLDQMRSNLTSIIRQSRAAGARTLLFEMRVPENYGPDYTQEFRDSFARVARDTATPLVPFFLMPLVAEPLKWFQDDGIHPNAAAQPQLLDAVWPSLQPLLGKPHPGR